MAKFVCTVCGYVYEGEAAPAECPICHAPAEKFVKQEGEMTWASEHVVGVAKGVSEDILADLRANFEGECSEVVCIWLWQELPTVRDIRRSECIMKKLLMKRQSTLQNLQSFLVKW